MKNNKPTTATKIKKMQNQIAEMKQTIHSIQTGKVDALFIHNKKSAPAIYSLAGADEPYRILIESLSEGAVTVDVEGRIIHCNKQFCELIKFSYESVNNTLLSDFILIDQKGLLEDLLNQAKHSSKKGEFNLIASDNSIKTVLLSCQSLKFGGANSVSIVVTDISEIKAVQLETYKAKERYRTLMDNASCGVIVHDPVGNIIEINKQTESILDKSRSEIINNNFISYIIPEERIKVEAEFEKLIMEKKIGPLEAKIQTLGDETKIIEFSSVNVATDISDENLLLTVINDITERKKLAEQTILNDKLATIGKLSAGIVHEINNPMTWIVSNLRYLRKKIKDLKSSDDNEIQSYSDIINETIKGTEKIQDIVLNLKGFARKDENLPLIPVDINEILQSAIAMASNQIEDIATLETNFAGKLPKLLINGSRLHQVFLNLIVNATQAFFEKNSKNIISINTSKDENNIRIDIADTGIGISPDKLPHIFDLFYTTKPRGIGTGLGLSICNDIINSEGGKITVNSIPGHGTIFSVFLPLKKLDASLTLEDDLISPREINEKI